MDREVVSKWCQTQSAFKDTGEGFKFHPVGIRV